MWRGSSRDGLCVASPVNLDLGSINFFRYGRNRTHAVRVRVTGPRFRSRPTTLRGQSLDVYIYLNMYAVI